MNKINAALESVTSDVARLELEASDIERILHGISSTASSSSCRVAGVSHRELGGNSNKGAETWKMMASIQSSSAGITNHDMQTDDSSPKPSTALQNLAAERRELAQNLQSELGRMDCSVAMNQGGTSKMGLLRDEDRLQKQLSVLQELDRQILTLKAQLKGRKSSNSKLFSASSSTESSSAWTEENSGFGMPNSGVKSCVRASSTNSGILLHDAASSIISFSSSMEGSGDRSSGFDRLGHKVEMVYSLLSMLSSNDRLESSRTLLLMSKAVDTCELMRQSGCVSHLIQLLHPGDIWSQPPTKEDIDVLTQAAEALHNLVQNQRDEKRKRRESRILKLLDQIRAYTLSLRLVLSSVIPLSEAMGGQEICPAVVSLMRLSFDEEHRKATSQLGGLHAIAEMLISDELNFGFPCPDSSSAIRRYAGMALTNLTFGDVQSKHTLCSFPRFLETVNAQIGCSAEELTQVYSSVVRNLSWKADWNSKKGLREGGCVSSLMNSAMKVEKESSLKSILSALWNLSAHCSENKAEICRIPGALAFLVSTLTYSKNSSSTTAVIENGGGILRNVSSHIAVKEEYRKTLREKNCFQILLRHLRSSSLTIVSNACGALWNLSARCATDQRILWELGAVPMLRSLIHSKHKNISLGSAAALKNLLSNQPPDINANDGKFGSLMQQRKLKALETELDQQLAGVCEKPYTDHMHGSNHSHSGAFMDGSGLAEAVSPVERGMSPGAQVVQMMDKLVQPVTFSPGRAHAHSVPPRSPETVSAAGPMPQSSSSQSLQRSDISASSTKEEKMLQDKAAVHRYHSSLRRAKRKLNQELDKAESEQPRNYADLFSERAKTKSQFIAPAEQDTVRAFCFEGTPLMSKSNSNTDLRGEKQEPRGSQPASPEKAPLKTSHLTHVDAHPEASNNVSNVVSPTFSRQSSVESLESCDQKSVRSQLPSVYSTRVPTGMVSPSDLPDSPGRSCPPSPGVRRAGESLPIRVPHSVDSTPLGFGLEGSAGLSAASSLSALTIDSETKIRTTSRPKQPTEEPEYATFDRGKESEILEQSILSAVPVRRHQAAVNSVSGKVPTAQRPTLPSAQLNQNCLKGEPEDTIRTFRYEGDAVRESSKPHDSPSGLSSVSGTSSRAEPASADSIRAVIKAAMPKPRSRQVSRNQGKAVAVAKPIMRPREDEETKVFAVEGTPANQSRSESPQQKELKDSLVESVDSSEVRNDASLEDCISLAMPKPKQQVHKSQRTPLKKKEKCKGTLSPEVAPSKAADEQSKGILDTSGISLVDSSTDCFLMKCSNATNLEDILPPEGLMDVSVSSCSLMRNSATSEKVKDASNLLLKDSLLRQVTAGSPKKQCAETQCDPTPGCAIKTSSEGSESLSEDNYSRIDEDENFDISPEDIDLNLVEEDANRLVIELQGGLTDGQDLDELISGGELLIECETLSLVSSESHVTNDNESESSQPELCGPKITLPSGLTSADKAAIRGGGKNKQKHSLSSPKMAVRTTKTAQLRAKRASESSSDGRSNSLGGSRTTAKGAGSPRPDVTDSEKPKPTATRQTDPVKRTKQPPPVPPKPKTLCQTVAQKTTKGSCHDQNASGPASARVSPFNYNRNAERKEGTEENKNSKNSASVRSSCSKRSMLVTTV